jgi:hypothetical protein
MKIRTAYFICGLILVAITASSSWAQSSDDSATRSKILALEHAWNQAEESKDLKAMDAILDNALVYVDFDGSLMSKAEFLSRVKTAPLQQVVTEMMTAQIFGSTAIVTGTYRSREFKDGKPFLRRGRFVDTWVNKDGAWVCVAAESTPVLR